MTTPMTRPIFAPVTGRRGSILVRGAPGLPAARIPIRAWSASFIVDPRPHGLRSVEATFDAAIPADGDLVAWLARRMLHCRFLDDAGRPAFAGPFLVDAVRPCGTGVRIEARSCGEIVGVEVDRRLAEMDKIPGGRR